MYVLVYNEDYRLLGYHWLSSKGKHKESHIIVYDMDTYLNTLRREVYLMGRATINPLQLGLSEGAD